MVTRPARTTTLSVRRPPIPASRAAANHGSDHSADDVVTGLRESCAGGCRGRSVPARVWAPATAPLVGADTALRERRCELVLRRMRVIVSWSYVLPAAGTDANRHAGVVLDFPRAVGSGVRGSSEVPGSESGRARAAPAFEERLASASVGRPCAFGSRAFLVVWACDSK